MQVGFELTCLCSTVGRSAAELRYLVHQHTLFRFSMFVLFFCDLDFSELFILDLAWERLSRFVSSVFRFLSRVLGDPHVDFGVDKIVSELVRKQLS